MQNFDQQHIPEADGKTLGIPTGIWAIATAVLHGVMMRDAADRTYERTGSITRALFSAFMVPVWTIVGVGVIVFFIDEIMRGLFWSLIALFKLLDTIVNLF